MILCKICGNETGATFAVCKDCQVKHPPKSSSGARLSDLIKESKQSDHFSRKIEDEHADWVSYNHEQFEKKEFERMLQEEMWDYERNKEFYHEHKVREEKEKLRQQNNEEKQRLKTED